QWICIAQGQVEALSRINESASFAFDLGQFRDLTADYPPSAFDIGVRHARPSDHDPSGHHRHA
ncbi:MAG: hypothetical protein E6417_09460, partial [Bradyrhizobium sp.]|nr:hypothetical protein [Bradyrhizobium sp.]